MKVWLDDLRPAPNGWLHVLWPQEAIELLEHGEVSHISLDHDLGDDERGTGYDVLLWIEQATMLTAFTPPVITVHSANISARQKMVAAIEKIRRIERARSWHMKGITSDVPCLNSSTPDSGEVSC